MSPRLNLHFPSLCCLLLLLLAKQPQALGVTVSPAWTVRNPLPTAAALRSIAWTGSRYVAVGDGGVALTSTNGTSWTRLSIAGTATLKHVVWSGAKLLATGGAADKVWTSADGLTWTQHDTAIVDGWFKEVIWTGSLFAAVSQLTEDGASDLLRSTDGITWTRDPINSGDSGLPTLNAVAKTSTRWIVVGRTADSIGVAYTSTNGTAWTQVSVGGGGLSDVVWMGTQYIAVGPFDVSGNASIFTSPTGATWTARTPPDEVHDTTQIIWTGSKLFGFGGSDTPSVVSSTDGVNWTQEVFDPDGIASPLTAGAWNGTRLVVVGEEGEIQTSPTGAVWTRHGPSGTQEILNDCVWTGTQFVAVGANGKVLTSPTGATWTAQADAPETYGFRAIEWTGSQLIGVGDSNGTMQALISADGLTWEAKNVSSSTGVLTDIAWNRAVAVAVADSGDIFTSPTGAVWTRRTVPGAHGGFNGITWTGSLFIAVGDGGAIYTSPTGTTWTNRSSSTGLSLSSVASSGANLVAVSNEFFTSSALVSTNGITWTEVTLPVEYLLGGYSKIIWTGKKFITCAGNAEYDHNDYDPDLLSSPDGLNWTAIDLPDRPALLGLVSTNSTVVAVGKGGAILTQPNTPSVQFAVAESSATEYGGRVSITVRLVPAQASAITVPFTITGTAQAGSDYTTSASPLTFAIGETVKTITITPTLDSSSEPDESIILTLGTPSGGVILEGNGTHTLTLLATPEVTFDSTSASLAEEDVELGEGVAFAVVRIPSPLPHDVSIPFTVTGSAKAGATLDYQPLRKSPLIIPAGQTEFTITLVLVDDTIPEEDEAVIISLGAPAPANVLLGTASAYALTITDSDVAPSISTQPTHQLVAKGQALTLTADINGSPEPALQWFRGSAVIARDVSVFEVTSTLTHAGSYRLKATNGGGTAASDVAEVAVVDASDRSLGLTAGSVATISVTTAGTAGTLSYQWRRNGSNLANSMAPDTRITGATTSKLVIKNLASATDDGAYTCLVTQRVHGVVRHTLVSGTTTLGVVSDKPVFSSIDLPAGIVLGTYSYRVPYASALATTPTSFKAKGLPAGITIDPVSGLISGRTTVAMPAPGKDVVIFMTNAKGTTSIIDKLIIAPLPAGVVGTFQGLLPRDPEWNEKVGSRVDLSVSRAGAVTGKIITGAKAFPFKGTLHTSIATANAPTLDTEVAMGPLGDPELRIAFDATLGGYSATLNEAGITSALEFSGWQNSWNVTNNKASAYKTLHNFALEQSDPDLALPQGFGFGSFTPVENTGAANVAGVFADGSAFTISTFIGPQGQVLLYQPLYGSRGSVMGVLTLTAGATPANNRVIGSATMPVTWFKPATLGTASDVVYREGIFVYDPATDEPTAITLDAVGAAYTPPQPGARVMGLPAAANNAKLDFAFGGLGDPGANPADQQFSVLVTVSNPSATDATNKAKIETDDHAVTMPLLDAKTGGSAVASLIQTQEAPQPTTAGPATKVCW